MFALLQTMIWAISISIIWAFGLAMAFSIPVAAQSFYQYSKFPELMDDTQASVTRGDWEIWLNRKGAMASSDPDDKQHWGTIFGTQAESVSGLWGRIRSFTGRYQKWCGCDLGDKGFENGFGPIVIKPNSTLSQQRFANLSSTALHGTDKMQFYYVQSNLWSDLGRYLDFFDGNVARILDGRARNPKDLALQQKWRQYADVLYDATVRLAELQAVFDTATDGRQNVADLKQIQERLDALQNMTVEVVGVQHFDLTPASPPPGLRPMQERILQTEQSPLHPNSESEFRPKEATAARETSILLTFHLPNDNETIVFDRDLISVSHSNPLSTWNLQVNKVFFWYPKRPTDEGVWEVDFECRQRQPCMNVNGRPQQNSQVPIRFRNRSELQAFYNQALNAGADFRR